MLVSQSMCINDVTLILQIYITKQHDATLVILRNQLHVRPYNLIPSEMIWYTYLSNPDIM